MGQLLAYLGSEIEFIWFYLRLSKWIKIFIPFLDAILQQNANLYNFSTNFSKLNVENFKSDEPYFFYNTKLLKLEFLKRNSQSKFKSFEQQNLKFRLIFFFRSTHLCSTSKKLVNCLKTIPVLRTRTTSKKTLKNLKTTRFVYFSSAVCLHILIFNFTKFWFLYF